MKRVGSLVLIFLAFPFLFLFFLLAEPVGRLFDAIGKVVL